MKEIFFVLCSELLLKEINIKFVLIIRIFKYSEESDQQMGVRFLFLFIIFIHFFNHF